MFQHFIQFYFTFQAHSENQSIASDQHLQQTNKQQHVSAEIHVQVHEDTHDEEESPYDIRKDTVSQNLRLSSVKRQTVCSLFINKRFALNEMFQRNASKFAIFYL